MMQLYCPACENVVWVEGDEPDEVVPCPACRQPIYWLGRRKARPVNEIEETPGSDPRLVAGQSCVAMRAPTPVPTVAGDTVREEDGAVWGSTVDQDFSLQLPEPPPVFVGLPYRPEGGVSPVRLPFYLAGIWLAGIGLGLLASFLGQICYLVLIYPLGMGLALAGVAVLAGHLARVRSTQVAGLVALVGGLLAVLSMHLLDFVRTSTILATEPYSLPVVLVEKMESLPGILGYFDGMAELGLTISGRDTGGLNLGYVGTFAYWGLELLLVLTIATAGGASGARDPYCPSCRVWKEDRFLGTLHDGEDMRRTLRRGHLSALECYRPSDIIAGEVVVTASVCPHCGRGCPVDVRLDRNPRAHKDPNRDDLPMRVTLPGEALPVLEQVFHPGRQLAA